MRPNDWTDECGQGHDKPTHVLHMCSPIRLVLPLRTHVALVLNSWAAQFLVLVTDNVRESQPTGGCRHRWLWGQAVVSAPQGVTSCSLVAWVS